MLGRIHTFKEFLDTWRIVREKGFDNINIDLISAIPGQTVQSWEKTLRTIAELGAEHISAYSLIIEEGTSFYRLYGEVHNSDGETPASCAEKNGGASGIPPLPGEDAEREIYKSTGRILKEYGYHSTRFPTMRKRDMSAVIISATGRGRSTSGLDSGRRP